MRIAGDPIRCTIRFLKHRSWSGWKIAASSRDRVEISPEGGVSSQKVDEIKVALWELGLSDDISSE
ncbi:MAG: hypothetical protein DMG72_21510 [Acidobacteria bacterium]|nr:MAG: hypothetical protein DMG72_21510 [Acidobacteriota bacterium]